MKFIYNMAVLGDVGYPYSISKMYIENMHNIHVWYIYVHLGRFG